ncbi:MAG: Wzz/FepE/Etk N-terminal domain-containing protein [Gammaproteobacteria bacterium]
MRGNDTDWYGAAGQFPITQSLQPDREPAIYDPRLNPDTPEDEIDLRDIWNTIVKYRWAILTFVGVVVATTLIATLLMRPVYKATTLIEVIPESRGLVKFQNVEQTKYRPREYFQTQASILRSESVASAVISKLALERNPEIGGLEQQRGFISGFRQLFSVAAEQPPVAEQDTERLRQRAILARFSGRLSVSARRKSDLFEVSFESFDPELSASVANTVVEEYKRLHEERRFDSTSGARRFLEREIKRIQAALERSEKDLTEFARKHQVIDLEDKSNIMTTRLTDLNKSLTKVQSKRIEA